MFYYELPVLRVRDPTCKDSSQSTPANCTSWQAAIQKGWCGDSEIQSGPEIKAPDIWGSQVRFSYNMQSRAGVKLLSPAPRACLCSLHTSTHMHICNMSPKKQTVELWKVFVLSDSLMSTGRLISAHSPASVLTTDAPGQCAAVYCYRGSTKKTCWWTNMSCSAMFSSTVKHIAWFLSDRGHIGRPEKKITLFNRYCRFFITLFSTHWNQNTLRWKILDCATLQTAPASWNSNQEHRVL